ncbi:MAG: hypothetical protein HKM04_01100 [Legionellales bacterium]|nr:hypothetical protein [Legionellales bacterium]
MLKKANKQLGVLPFEPLVPNKKTIAAMQIARRGELITVSGVDELLDSLNEED